MPFIILDRDGVINYDSDEYIKSPDEWIPIPGSLEAVAELNKANYEILIATNQSGITRGHFDLKTLAEIHDKMHQALAKVNGSIKEIFFCPHHPEDNCLCRKPKPGLLHQMQEKYALNFADIFFIGDSFVDVQAAQAVGCQPILVMTGKGQQVFAKHPELATIPNFADLAEAVRYILSSKRK